MEKEYQKLAKKYGLPSYEKIEFDFEISKIDEEEYLLREIRRRITEKLDAYAKLLEALLKPEMTLTDLYECRVFTEEEKEEIIKTYKQLIYYDRYSIETSINETEEKTVAFIKELYTEWEEIKIKLTQYFKELKESWKKETKIETDTRYVG